jgi:hypothetical protein
MTNTPDDSGHRSVAGYFYQALLTSAMPVELYEAAHRDRTGDGFELVSAVYPEEHGQDAVFIARAGKKVIAKVVQHKFSRWPERTSNDIQPTELFDILETLDLALKHVKSRYPVEPRICLHTNRKLSQQSRQFLEDSKAKRPNKDLDETIEHSVGKGKKKKTFFKGRTVKKNALYRRCLENLEYEVKHVADAQQALRKRAACFGVLPEEVADRIKRIEGEIYGSMTQAACREITREDLDKWLTGDANPKEICSRTTMDCMHREINDAGGYLKPFEPLLSRDKQRDLAAAKLNPVVLIVGEGGVGKSALVFQYLLSLLKNPPRQYVGASHVRDVSANWCGGLFCHWRDTNDHNIRLSDPGTILRRLELATENCELPLLILWLDGIDERHSDSTVRETLRQLQPLLREEKKRIHVSGVGPRLQLILTCRRVDDYETQFGEEDQFMHGHQSSHSIRLDRFTDLEMSNLPQGFVPDSVAQRLQSTLASLQSNGGDADDGRLNRVGGLKLEDAMPFLHPPLMAALREVGEHTANACLDQEPDAMRQVASVYLKWFAYKVCRRARAQEKEDVYSLLQSVVDATTTQRPPLQFNRDWKTPATSSGFTAIQARDMFREALSAGLIDEQGNNLWNWKSKYVTLGIQANTIEGEVVS